MSVQRCCLAAVLAGFLSTTTGGQESDALVLGGVRLVLGASEATVRQELGLYHSISEGGFVTTKHGPPYELIGSVTFKNGRLEWATKNWDRLLDQTGSVDVIRRLIGMIGDQKGCFTTTTNIKEPQFVSSTLAIKCAAARQIEASISEEPGSGRPAYVNLREVYGPKR